MRALLAIVLVAACGDDGGHATDGGADAAALDALPDAAPVTCTTKPDETTTGIPAGAQLSEIDGDVTVTTDGTVIEEQDIHGFLRIQANNVVVRDSVIRGTATDATTAILRIDSGTNILVEDTEIAVTTPSVDVDGIWAANATIRRVHIHGGVDGMKASDNTIVECSYIHDLVEFDSDPNQNGGPTHNDAIQILDGAHIEISHNQLTAAMSDNSAIQVTQDFGPVSDLLIHDNWSDGGGCTFNFSHKGGDSLAVTTRDNRFGRNSFFDCPILESTQTTLDHMGDVWDDDGTPVPIQTHD
ncbi:MAG TPA: hypothetical protein VGM88_33965 [Kofleriaceae bacterium]|jgi:hypothetical protein